MNRAKRRRLILPYLKKFFLNFILYKEWPVRAKLAAKNWASDMYEQLDEDQKDELYNKLINRKDDNPK